MNQRQFNARQPVVEFFSSQELDELHVASLEILENTGLHVHHEEAKKLLFDAGALIHGDLVKIPAGLVRWALNSAPQRVVLADRNKKRSMSLENRKVYFGTGSDLIHTIDLETGLRRPSVLQDVANAAKLCDALPNIDFLMSYALPSDVPGDIIEVLQVIEMMRNSTKPIVMTAFNSNNTLKKIIDLCAISAGGLSELQENPYLCIYGQFVSPLVHTAEAIDRLMTCAENRIPLIYIPTIMAGMSGPATMSGSLAIGNAEVLAGLVMSQLKRKGAPFIFGGCISSFDMSRMILPYGAPEWHMASSIMAQMARKYQLPVFSTAGCSDAKKPDEQATAEASLSILLAGLSGANLIHDIGYLESGLTGSLAFITMCDEIIGYTKRILRNFDINPGALALDIIRDVGPAGSFIGEEHTADNFMNETWYPKLWNRDIYDQWHRQGETSFYQQARNKAINILNTHQPEPIKPKIRGQVDEFIQNLMAGI